MLATQGAGPDERSDVGIRGQDGGNKKHGKRCV